LIEEMRLERGKVGLSLVRRLSGEAVKEDTTEGVEVRAPVEGLTLDLLGAAVLDGAEEQARLGHPRGARALREAEVAEVGVLARLGDEDVRRLDVAMDEAGLVRAVERAADLLGDPQCLHRWQRSPRPEQRLQATSHHIAHG
jgi:hypothetical protein